jgi:hypothetical protein
VQGPQGDPGPAGPQGPAGPAGAQGPAGGISGYEIVTKTTSRVYDHDETYCSSHDIFGGCTGTGIRSIYRQDPAVAECPAGKVALFGWASDGATGSPRMSSGLLVGWQAGTTTYSQGATGTLTAYAVCANQAS